MTALEQFKRMCSGETQRACADMLGISVSYMSDIWNGRRRLTAKLLLDLDDGKEIYLKQCREEAERDWKEAVRNAE